MPRFPLLTNTWRKKTTDASVLAGGPKLIHKFPHKLSEVFRKNKLFFFGLFEEMSKNRTVEVRLPIFLAGDEENQICFSLKVTAKHLDTLFRD